MKKYSLISLVLTLFIGVAVATPIPTFTPVERTSATAPGLSNAQINAIITGISNTANAAAVGVNTEVTRATAAEALALIRSNNLSDISSVSLARLNLGLGSLATQSGSFSGSSSGINTGDQDLSGLVSKTTSVNGHALSSNVTLTNTDIGLANVNNTSDLNKPISTAVAALVATEATRAETAETALASSVVVNVKSCGATGNGVTDDTAAIQSCISNNPNSAVWMSCGNYLISANIISTGSTTLFSFNKNCTYITWTSPTLNVLTFTSANGPYIHGITFNGPTTATGGAVITLSNATTQNSDAHIEGNNFLNCWDCIVGLKAATYTIEHNTFARYWNHAIEVENGYNVDSGDSSIINNIFSQQQGTGAIAVHQISSGGLKVFGNKCNGGSACYRLDLAGGAATSDLLIGLNSFENCTSPCIYLTTNGGASSFSNVVIGTNQLALNPGGIYINPAYVAFSNVAVSGNTINSSGGSENIYIGNTNQFSINGNTLTGGATYAVTVGTGITNGTIGVNNYGPFSTKINGTQNSNLHITDTSTLSGSPSVTCTGPFGTFGLYYVSYPVVFAVAFDAPPTVLVTTGTVSGGVSAIVSGAVTKTGFTANIFSATSGCTGTFNWSAKGLI